jgi:argininosuccinate lyase
MKERSKRESSTSANDEFLAFTGSVGFDRRLWKYDIAGSIAHAYALEKAGILSEKERRLVVGGLRAVAADIGDGSAGFRPELEDIHMNVERMLTEKVGRAGEKIHTGRSRNDQVALDMRLLVREAITDILAETLAIQTVIVRRSDEAMTTVMPGYTHLQRAQPVLLAHHLMAHFWRLQRDAERLTECYSRTNRSPLGSGALAGTSFGIDRRVPADMLRMEGLTENSLDAVSDRDFVAETAFDLSLIMIHLSSLCEELILWSSHEFGFVKLPESMSSGSSMMPQKRNPDLPELIRGKSGRAVGDLIAILTVLKSLPLAYNRDLQEDKETLFDVLDTTGASLHALTHFLREIEFDTVRMGKSAEAGLMTATDLADFLSKAGVPFRTAHSIVRDIVGRSGGDNDRFMKLAEGALRAHVKGFKPSDLDLHSASAAVERRGSRGGTSTKAVKAQKKLADAAMTRTEHDLGRMRAETSSVNAIIWP